jgi:hypothetical protein
LGALGLAAGGAALLAQLALGGGGHRKAPLTLM